jgi:hypothetical protein
MANTVLSGPHGIRISGLDEDYISDDYKRIIGITFIPGAATDRMIVRDGGIDAVPIFDSGPAASTIPIYKKIGGERGLNVKPVIDISDCTLAAGTLANCSVLLDFA